MFVSAVVAFGFENLFAFVAIALDGAEAVPHGSDTHTHTPSSSSSWVYSTLIGRFEWERTGVSNHLGCLSLLLNLRAHDPRHGSRSSAEVTGHFWTNSDISGGLGHGLGDGRGWGVLLLVWELL